MVGSVDVHVIRLNEQGFDDIHPAFAGRGDESGPALVIALVGVLSP